MKQRIVRDRSAMIEAVVEAAEMIATTMGPSPNVVTVATPGGGVSINDGVQILKTLCPVNSQGQRILVDRDPVIDLGYERLIRAAESTLRQAGDGTSSTALIFAKLLEIGEVRAEKERRSDIVKQIEKDAEIVLAEIDAMVRSGESIDTLKAVASIAMHGHEWAPKIAELLWDLGLDGTFTVEVAPDGGKFETEKVPGFQWGAGTLPECFNARGKFECGTGAYVVVIASEVSDIKDIEGILKTYSSLQEPGVHPSNWTPLVLVCANCNGNAKSSLLARKVPYQGGYALAPFVLVGLPKGADYEQLRDVAAATGSELFDRSIGTNPSKLVEPTDFGLVQKVIITDRSAMFVPDGENKELEKRIADLEESLSELKDEAKSAVQDRLGRLRGKYGVIRVPVTTESEFGFLKEMVEDCYRAVQSAMEYGVVPGGGWALFWIALNKLDADSVLSKAIIQPRCALVQSYCIDHGDGDQIDDDPWKFVTLDDRKQVNALKSGVIDNARSVKSSVSNAVKEASLLLLSEFIIINDQR